MLLRVCIFRPFVSQSEADTLQGRQSSEFQKRYVLRFSVSPFLRRTDAPTHRCSVSPNPEAILPNTKTLEAIYEDGILRPLEALEGLSDHSKVRITIDFEERHPLLQFAGILSDREAAELRRTIQDEFERIDPNAW